MQGMSAAGPDDPPPPVRRESDGRRNGRLAQCLEVLHRVAQVPLD
jgi:hypothetical protein